MRTLTVAALAAVLLVGCSPASETPVTEQPSEPVIEVSVPADPDEALAVALRDGDAAAVEAALARGADPNLDLGAGVTALAAAVRRDDAVLVALLAEAGADLEATDTSGYTALHRAGEGSGYDVVIALIEAGADYNAHTRDVYNITPLHAAANKNNVDAIEAFIAAGVPVDIRNDAYEGTPLHYAAFSNSLDAIEALLALGADPMALQFEGYTPLQVAQLNGNTQAASLLERVTG